MTNARLRFCTLSEHLKAHWQIALVVGLFSVVVAIAGVIFLPGALAANALRRAAEAIRQGQVTSAKQWLGRAEKLAPRDGRVFLLRATLYRRLNQPQAFGEALSQAKRLGTPSGLTEQEQRLALIQAGRLTPGKGNDVGDLIAQGYDPNQVAEAFIYGAIARKHFEEAERVLTAWRADRLNDPNVIYMEGVYHQHRGDLVQAENAYRKALALEPHHELALLALCELLEQQDRWGEVLAVSQQWYESLPQSDLAKACFARALRSKGDWETALAILRSDVGQLFASPELIREMAELELELGCAAQARQWLRHIDYHHTSDRALLHTVALAEGLSGSAIVGLQLMERADQLFRELCRRQESQLRRSMGVLGPIQQQTEDAGESTAGHAASFLVARESERTSSQDRKFGASRTPEDLYARFCASCHGEKGDGDGVASRFLFPRPRNLRRDFFRIVSTENAIPSVEDIAIVIRYGMPGTSMRDFDELSPQELFGLAQLVIKMRREGVQDRLLEEYQKLDEEISPEELRSVAEIQSTPGPRVAIPLTPSFSEELLARGRAAYNELGCSNCHGVEGTNHSDLALWDDWGFPNPPRNLRHDLFKGGESFAELYLRIRLGMPGTAHPACLSAPPDQATALVIFCQSLRMRPASYTTNYERWLHAESLAWSPAYVSSSPATNGQD